MPDEIVQFIKNFSAAKDTFLNGCCYWFAFILSARFHCGIIMYEPVEGHFVYAVSDNGNIGGIHGQGFHFYDVRGDVTELYADKPLYSLDYLDKHDPPYYARLMRDCRDIINTM